MGRGRFLTDERGQTLQDYVVGVVVVLLATFFVIAYLPNVFASYDSPTDGIRSSQADRVAEYILTNYSVEDQSHELRYDGPGGLHDTLSTEAGMNALRDQTSLNTSTDRRLPPDIQVFLVNASTLSDRDELVPAVHRGNTLSYGDTYRGQAAARSIRVVTMDNETICDPSCWLVVRVW
ncbi:DUF7287 family protein [Halapricum desulfuricans]|uniref:Putative pilin/flagellin n=1 Tax=Halapricum desulfuricans TaxID=2841257 RepID=A0A897NR26_9EURY|nr:hypothetical protein [Halapricum desulfuricans]QSG14884.1 putative pilin/flagellin [Halapricum desulfuricans]